MPGVDDIHGKYPEKRFATFRITTIFDDEDERKKISSVLANNNLQDIVELSELKEAWNNLEFSSSNLLIFSSSTSKGEEFLSKLIESTRFKLTPLIVFTDKLGEHRKIFYHEEVIIQWVEEPWSSHSLEAAVKSVLARVVNEKSKCVDETKSLEHFTLAIEALNNNENEKALELLQLSLDEQPDFFEVYLKMTETLINMGEHEAASKLAKQASDMREDNPKVMILESRIAADTQSKDEAIKVMDVNVSKRPFDIMFIVNIGNIALDKEWFEDAIGYYEMAKEADPETIYIYNRLGIAYSRMSKYQMALNMYELAMKIDDKNAGLHFNIGMTFCRKGDMSEALKCFEMASALDGSLSESKMMIENIKKNELSNKQLHWYREFPERTC